MNRYNHTTQTVGFEPTLQDGNRFLVDRLNQLGHICCYSYKEYSMLCSLQMARNTIATNLTLVGQM